MTNTLFDAIRRFLSGTSQLSDTDATHLLYLVYTLCKVRGYKTVSKLFPHSVEDLEPTYKLLEKFRGCARTPEPTPDANVEDHQPVHPLILQAQQFALDEIEWRVPYVLLLWLSVIGLIPFDLNALDNDSSGMPLKHKLLDIAHHFLRESSITRNAASELLSTLLTRPDMKAELATFVDTAVSTVTRLSTGPSSELLISTNQYHVAGLYMTLALIFQKGEREQLVPHVLPILKAFFPASTPSDSTTPSNQSTNTGSESEEMTYDLPSNALINKKLSVKLVQRLGLALLHPRIPKWRYQRRTVSLLHNLSSKSSQPSSTTSSNVPPQLEENNDDDDNDEEYDIPNELEIFVQLLLSALRDKDTIVRWSAAKGIGRLTHRLPQALADEIVGSLLELFDSRETDCAWHGACLSIAELARRGLLLPSRLSELLDKLNKALQFEIRRGTYSTGHHVRDAACYVAWALARAYDPELLKNYLAVSLASSLLITALFDREVNCRRAAAAAFQEHVGRQGSFPHGIEVITLVNFFTLSNRSEAYLTLAPQVAAFEDYTKPLIDHLAFSKSRHVDHTIRKLSSQALGKLALQPAHQHYIATHIVPNLIPYATNPDFATRQGSIQVLAEIVLSFASLTSNELKTQEQSTTETLPSPTVSETPHDASLNLAQKSSSSSSGVQESTQPTSLDEHAHSMERRNAVISKWIAIDIQEKLWNIPADVDRARLYRGRSAEHLRVAVCRLISAISELGLSLKSSGKTSSAAPGAKATAVRGPAIAQRLASGTGSTKTGKDTLTFFIETLEENLRQPLEDVVNVAVDATRSLALRYLPSSSHVTDALLDRWMKIIASDTNQAARRGHCLAIGALPLESLSPLRLPQIISCLLSSMKILGNKSYLDDAEVRKNAIVGLCDLVNRVPLETSTTSPSSCCLTNVQVKDIINAYLTSMDDYTTDNRGDIGSLVREAAISAFGWLLLKLCPSYSSSSTTLAPSSNAKGASCLVSKDVLMAFVGRLVRLALEKIDRTRERAGVMLEQLVRCTAGVPSTASLYRFATWSQVSFETVYLDKDMIPQVGEVWKMIDETSRSADARSVITKGLNWTSSRVVFPLLVPLLRFDEYRYWVVIGIIRSVGGANNGKELVEDATNSLMTFVRSLHTPDALDQFSQSLIAVMKNNVGNEQVITALWVTIDVVLASAIFYNTLPANSTFASDLLALSRAELRLPSSISKIHASVAIFAHLLSFQGVTDAANTRNQALKMMLFFLGYKYPVIRKLAAEALYLQLETSPQIIANDTNNTAKEETLEKAKDILSTVSWAWDTEYQAAKENLTSILVEKSTAN